MSSIFLVKVSAEDKKKNTKINNKTAGQEI